MGRLDNKVAVITGAGSGVGREHALLLASEGAQVVVNDIGEAADDTVARINSNGGEAVSHIGSVSDWNTGEDLVATAYLKPISTTLNPLKSVNLASGEQVETVYERSDTCAVPRAVPIFETVLALEVLQCLLEKSGGDNRREIVARKNQFTGLSIEDFNMSDEKWNMNYDT